MSSNKESSNEDDIMTIRERNIRELKEEFQKTFGTELLVVRKEISQPKSNRLSYNRKKFIGATRNDNLRRSRRVKRAILEDENEEEENDNYSGKIQVSCMPKIRLKLAPRKIVVTADEVTEEMIENIYYKSVGKIYDAINGTTCHQCRQKTMDIKSICRNSKCTGRRGQFCGFCLQKRYGESVAEVLRNPEWQCPVCRNICNCSLCRAKLGKRPTGVLVPIAEKNGFKSVKEFLDNCKQKDNTDPK